MSKIIRIVSIGFLSILWIVVSFHSFQMNDYSLFVYYWGIDDLLDNILLTASWTITIIACIILCWKILKSITIDYRYHLFYWIIVMSLFTYPIIANRGWYWFQIGIFIGLPAICINYLSNGFKPQNLLRHKKISYVILVGIFIVGGVPEYQVSNSAKFSNSQYEFEVNTYTIPTFLDWQVEAEIEITDKRTGNDFEFDFSFGDGPYFKVCKDIKSDTILYIKGFNSNSGRDWTINLNSGKIDDNYYSDGIENIELIATHDSDFELK